MVLSNKRRKQRRLESAQSHGRPEFLYQAQSSPAPQPGLPATAIEESELITYSRCIETLLHEKEEVQNAPPCSRPKQRQDAEDVAVNTHEDPALIGLDTPNSPLSNVKSKKRKKAKERNAFTKPQEEMEADKSSKDQEFGDSRTVYVGGIPYYSSEDDIKAFFGDCGTICEVSLKTFKDSGKFRGIALLTFKTVGGAERALALDGANMGDRFLKIQQYAAKSTERVKKNQVYNGPPSKMEGYNRAYIGNLAWSVTEEDIREFFRDCKVDSVRFSQDKTTGNFQGFGHVDFKDDESLELALQKDQAMLLERPLKVAYAVPKKSQQSKGGSSKDKKEVICYACGDKGHLSSRCPLMGRA